MTQIKKRKTAQWFGALLAFALLLSGCSGNSGSAGSASAGSSVSQSGSQSSSQSDTSTETTDFRKYNAYSDVASDVLEMDGLLGVYFTVVQDQPEFALADGMDYGMLSDVFSGYMPVKFNMESAVSYNDEEPAYPEQDALLLDLQQPYYDMQDILQDISVYLTYQDYLEDDLAQAKQLHTKLYEAVSAFDAAAWPFVESMDALDQATEQQALDSLKANGMYIAFYSRTIINLCNEMDADIWAQVETSETLPALDMTNLEELYTQYQEAYASLTQALDDEEQVNKVYNWASDEYWSETYHDDFVAAVDTLNTALTAFMETARSQSDYSESYSQLSEAVSELIDQYNASIV